MDPLQWMGAARMRVQTADKNITIIHTTPVHKLTSCEVKSYMFLIKLKSIIRTFFHQIAFSSQNAISSESGEKYAQIKHGLQTKIVQNISKQVCMLVDFDVRGQQGMGFLLEEALLWIIDLCFGQKWQF